MYGPWLVGVMQKKGTTPQQVGGDDAQGSKGLGARRSWFDIMTEVRGRNKAKAQNQGPTGTKNDHGMGDEAMPNYLPKEAKEHDHMETDSAPDQREQTSPLNRPNGSEPHKSLNPMALTIHITQNPIDRATTTKTQ